MTADALAAFYPAVRAWFARRFGAPTDAQAAGWPHIVAERDTLLDAVEVGTEPDVR